MILNFNPLETSWVDGDAATDVFIIDAKIDPLMSRVYILLVDLLG